MEHPNARALWAARSAGLALILAILVSYAGPARAYDCSGPYGGGGPSHGPEETGVECELFPDTDGTMWERRASYWIPPGDPGTGTYPVVFAFHGGGLGEWDCSNSMRLNDHVGVTDREFILVCPRPLRMLNGDLGWIKHFGKFGSHDPAFHDMDEAFIEAFIETFTDGVHFDGDPGRVFLVGFSGAAAFVHGFAAQHRDVVAAAMMMAGPVGGYQNDGHDDPENRVLRLGSARDSSACADTPSCVELDVANSIYPDERGTKAVGALPVLLIHSFDDSAKPYHGGTGFVCAETLTPRECNTNRRARTSFASDILYPGALSTIGWWVRNNGCDPGQFTYREVQWNAPSGIATDYDVLTYSTACPEVRATTIYAGWDHTYQNESRGNFDTNAQTLAFFEHVGGGLGSQP